LYEKKMKKIFDDEKRISFAQDKKGGAVKVHKN
jgi:hypothetical protein